MIFSAKIIGMAATKRALARYQARLSRIEATNRLAAVEVVKWITRNFEDEGKAFGGWKSLSPATIEGRRKGKKAGGPKILQDMGLLKNSWLPTVNRSETKVTSTVERNPRNIGGVHYGIYHHKGIGVPKRPIIPTQKIMAPILRKIYIKHIIDSIRS